LEELIASSWCNTLKLERVSIDDNFFELGGHSLLAIRVVDAIKRSSGKTIKVADLFRYATVAELARLLSNPSQADDNTSFGTYLESIRPGQYPVNLVIVGAKLRVPLETLAAEIPVWWLKLDGLHVWPPQHLNLTTQADIHTQELIKQIPSGRIVLCGHSYGGLLAIEIARQLKKAGNHDIQLVLLEPPLPSHQTESVIKRVAHKVSNLKKRMRQKLIQELARGLHKRTIGKINRMVIGTRLSDDQKIAADDRWRYMEPFLLSFINEYQLPDFIPHDVHLIKTTHYSQDYADVLKQVTTGHLYIHAVSQSLDHLDIANTKHSSIWMSVVQKLIVLAQKE
jgi:acyl carrier protein